jgi:plasmid stability protein
MRRTEGPIEPSQNEAAEGGARTADAVLAPGAGTAYTRCMQYTLRNIPAHVDRALRDRVAREGKSLNEVAIEALERGLDLEGHPVRRRDLGEIAGSWVRDREVDRALEDQRRVDPDLWR